MERGVVAFLVPAAVIVLLVILIGDVHAIEIILHILKIRMEGGQEVLWDAEVVILTMMAGVIQIVLDFNFYSTEFVLVLLVLQILLMDVVLDVQIMKQVATWSILTIITHKRLIIMVNVGTQSTKSLINLTSGSITIISL
jgi:hypothetical protein